ncbi:DMP19 family protein [Enterovibrio paralichthyis]|uniref:DMP19 family protein n=1 Tax=Enterovibrio paralichthyis TaxID=2853805 RepID=UPI001C438654|nr:DMP19 family protein [Enterovibrio paralichthyis]MBV7297392.1 DMP19 family protein [Enterovibrio paralichthyis]
MKFKDYAEAEEPALEVFKLCLDAVFDPDDGTTEHLERLSPEARFVYLLWCFDGEVHNGGFDQLFFNSLGDHCAEILSNLRAIGASRSAELLAQAMIWFPDASPSPIRAERWKQLSPFEDDEHYHASLDALDNAFYKYEDNLVELLHHYVRQHPEAKVMSI